MQEPFVADLAGVTSVTLVDGRMVAFQGGNVGERPLAFGTHVRPLAGVNRHVLLQVAELRELATAHVAGERSNIGMKIHVYLPFNNNGTVYKCWVVLIVVNKEMTRLESTERSLGCKFLVTFRDLRAVAYI